MANLPLTPVVDVTYNLAPAAAARRGFDTGLIIGPSEIIDPEERVQEFGDLEEAVDAGFTDGTPEYDAAVLYFAARSRPSKLAIGVQASGESALQALTACRQANSEWYAAYITNASNADHLACAAYIEALSNPSVYFMQSDDSDVLGDVADNIFEQLAEANYRRTIGFYSTTTDHGVCSIMGYAMGQTSDAANSAYTLKFKEMPGVTPETLTTAQYNNITGNNGNVLVTRRPDYPWFENGKMFDGTWFDETIYLDKLANETQLNVADLLYQNPKIPQTETGMARIRTVINQACDKLVNIGFIAPGKWNGGDILELHTGEYLPTGYLVQSESIDDQSQADRDAREAPPIYVAIKLAGAIHAVLIRINVNR